jgi:hypothetical protein
MTSTSRLLLQIARWIAGPERREWIDAMEAEAVLADANSISWAVGCLLASVRDRLLRERYSMLAVVLLPPIVFALNMVLFVPTVQLVDALAWPHLTLVGFALVTPVPFAFAMGLFMPLRRALTTGLLCGVVNELVNIVFFWIYFGQGPEIWFHKGATVYMMTPALGWACGISFWIAGAWAGGAVRRRKRPITG